MLEKRTRGYSGRKSKFPISARCYRASVRVICTADSRHGEAMVTSNPVKLTVFTSRQTRGNSRQTGRGSSQIRCLPLCAAGLLANSRQEKSRNEWVPGTRGRNTRRRNFPRMIPGLEQSIDAFAELEVSLRDETLSCKFRMDILIEYFFLMIQLTCFYPSLSLSSLHSPFLSVRIFFLILILYTVPIHRSLFTNYSFSECPLLFVL